MKLTMKAARINAGYDRQIDAAIAIGVTKDTLGAWETGKRLPNVKYIPIIEKVYNIKYNDIIFLSFNNALSIK